MDDIITRMTEDYIQDDSTESLMKVLTKVRRAYLAPTSILPNNLHGSEFLKKFESVKVSKQSSEIMTQRSPVDGGRQLDTTCGGGSASRRSPMICRSVERSVSLPPFLRPIEEETQSEGMTSRSETETEDDDDVSSDDVIRNTTNDATKNINNDVTKNINISTSQGKNFRSEPRHRMQKTARTQSADGASIVMPQHSVSRATATTTATTTAITIATASNVSKVSETSCKIKPANVAVLNGENSKTKERNFEQRKTTINYSLDGDDAANSFVKSKQENAQKSQLLTSSGDISAKKCTRKTPISLGQALKVEEKLTNNATEETAISQSSSSTKAVVRPTMVKATTKGDGVTCDVGKPISGDIPPRHTSDRNNATMKQNISFSDSNGASASFQQDCQTPIMKSVCDKGSDSNKPQKHIEIGDSSSERITELSSNKSSICSFAYQNIRKAFASNDNKLIRKSPNKRSNQSSSYMDKDDKFSVKSTDFNCCRNAILENASEKIDKSYFCASIDRENVTMSPVSDENAHKPCLKSFSNGQILCLPLVSCCTFIANFYSVSPSYLVFLVFIMSALCIRLSGQSDNISQNNSTYCDIKMEEYPPQRQDSQLT